MWNPHLLKQKVGEPVTLKWQFTRFVALSLATLFFIVTLLAIGGNLYYIWAGDNLPLRLLAFGLILLTAYTTIPRFVSEPPEVVRASSKEFPALNQFVAEIANLLHVQPPTLLISEHFTASFAHIGWHRHPILVLGHPFISILDKDELAGLVAHELAHARDGSWSRRLYFRLASAAIRRWCYALDPSHFWHTTPLIRLFFLPLIVILSICSLPFYTLRYFLMLLSSVDAQRAEYIADSLSAEIAGKYKAQSLLHKSLYGNIGAVRRAYKVARPNEKRQALIAQIEQLPDDVIDRVMHYTAKMPKNAFDTHPPLVQRDAFLRSRPNETPAFSVSTELFLNLQAELIEWPELFLQRVNENSKPPTPATMILRALAPVSALYHDFMKHESDETPSEFHDAL